MEIDAVKRINKTFAKSFDIYVARPIYTSLQ